MSFNEWIKNMIGDMKEIKYLVKHPPKPAKTHSLKLRGVGYTRKNKEQSKVRRRMAKASRRINRKMA